MKRKTIASGLKSGYIICATTRKIKTSKSELSALRANKIGIFGSIVQAVSNFLS